MVDWGETRNPIPALSGEIRLFGIRCGPLRQRFLYQTLQIKKGTLPALRSPKGGAGNL